MKKLLCLLAIISVSIFGACSDDSAIIVDPPLENRFYPLSTTAFSEFRTVVLGENNTELTASEEIITRSWSNGGTFFGASGRREFTTYNDGTIDTGYVSNVNNMVHWHQSPFELPGLAANRIMPEWVKIADFGNTTGWTILNDSLKGLRFEADTNWRFNGLVTKTALKGGMVNVVYGNNETVSAREFTYVTTFNGTVVLDSLSTAPLQFMLHERTYFAENIGLVKYEQDFTNVEIMSERYPVYGYRIELIRRGVR
ncbi:MAG TPA: hypothetical protein VEC36_00135 [Patescibacteria group bacterium]|nr:hypothetical protein [Patescibacteria group bacterium]